MFGSLIEENLRFSGWTELSSWKLLIFSDVGGNSTYFVWKSIEFLRLLNKVCWPHCSCSGCVWKPKWQCTVVQHSSGYCSFSIFSFPSQVTGLFANLCIPIVGISVVAGGVFVMGWKGGINEILLYVSLAVCCMAAQYRLLRVDLWWLILFHYWLTFTSFTTFTSNLFLPQLPPFCNFPCKISQTDFLFTYLKERALTHESSYWNKMVSLSDHDLDSMG